jgi:Rha family phage regulatory protein
MSEIIELAITNGQPTTTSLAIAERFGKNHNHVLRDIEKLACSKEFTESNFGLSAYKDSTGRALPMYQITKDGFMFLCMGFTGKEAAAWKERFIAAFNAMEQQLLENAAAQQIPKPDGTLFLSHRADIMVAADRTFRAAIRSGRMSGMATAVAIRRANEITRLKTGLDMLAELQFEPAQEDDSRAVKDEQALEQVQNFWATYEGGGLPGEACLPLLSTQVHKLYLHWHRENAVGFPLGISNLIHILRSAGLVQHKRARYSWPNGVLNMQATFVIPEGDYGPPPNQTMAQWLGECVEHIEQALEQVKRS